jgi:Phage phiEco32-like COOH.NH2 ligase-type 2
VKNISLGADPEIFLADESTGTIVPVCGWLGGTKEKHHALRGCEVHEDGCAAELTFPPVMNDPGMMVSHGQQYMSRVVEYATKKKGRYLVMWTNPVAKFTQAELNAIGPLANTFGCSPEFAAYDQGQAVPIVNAEALREGEHAYRFAGGHIHIGYREACPELPPYVAAMLCDATIGLSLVAHGEKQGKRRQLYGQPGRFRPTPYGLEYRVPSNTWLYNGSAGDAVVRGLNVLCNWMREPIDTIRSRWNSLNWPEIQQLIQTENHAQAGQLLKEI